jgi:hypothetical protein
MTAIRSSSKDGDAPPSSYRWFLGMMVASLFSMIYFVAPFYMFTALLAILFRFPSAQVAWIYASPIFVSAFTKPVPMPIIFKFLRPILDYFDYEEIFELSPVDVRKEILENGKNYLCVFQPHGALSYTAIASIVNAAPEWQGRWNESMIVCSERLTR